MIFEVWGTKCGSNSTLAPPQNVSLLRAAGDKDLEVFKYTIWASDFEEASKIYAKIEFGNSFWNFWYSLIGIKITKRCIMI